MPAERRRIRLTLRGLMFLVLVMGGWLGWRVHLARLQREAVAAVRRHGGWVHYDYEFVNDKPTPGRQPWGPRWLRQRLGDEYFQEIRSVSFAHDDFRGAKPENEDDRPVEDALAALSTQHGLRWLSMEGTQATDTGLAHLRRWTGLEHLLISGSTQVSDAGLANLRGLVNLKTLYVSDCRATDDGFLSLSPLVNLETLVLGSPNITDRGLAAVSGMQKLTWLSLSGTRDRPSRISDVGLKYVGRLENLKRFDARFSRVTDRGTAELKGLTRLENLDLDGCRVGDKGMRNLAGLKELQFLSLNGSYVGDEGMKRLEGLANLRFLELGDSLVSDESKQAFKKSMPSLNHID